VVALGWFLVIPFSLPPNDGANDASDCHRKQRRHQRNFPNRWKALPKNDLNCNFVDRNEQSQRETAFHDPKLNDESIAAS
jgi:hypothetical protein